MNQLFQRKPISELLAESDTSLKRVLGAGDLVMLAIGAVIGAGIFSSIGTAAAGEVLPGEVVRYGAGPALVLSFVLLGVVCGLAGLCYAELAAMIPQAGSAYAYSYATLGELIAWIIGWDLILEYAVGNIAVAIAWSGYFNSLLSGFGVELPDWLTHGYRTALLSSDPAVHGAAADRAAHRRHSVLLNIPAALIVLVITWLLYIGVKESARANNIMVVVKLLVLGSSWSSARCTSIPPTTRRLRRTAGRASTRAPRSCSSPTSGSTRYRRPPRRRRIRSATCRSGSSAGWPSAR